MGDGKVFVVDGFSNCESSTDNVIVMVGPAVTSAWVAAPVGLVSPREFTYPLQSFRREDAVSIAYTPQQASCVRCLTLYSGIPPRAGPRITLAAHKDVDLGNLLTRVAHPVHLAYTMPLATRDVLSSGDNSEPSNDFEDDTNVTTFYHGALLPRI